MDSNHQLIPCKGITLPLSQSPKKLPFSVKGILLDRELSCNNQWSNFTSQSLRKTEKAYNKPKVFRVEQLRCTSTTGLSPDIIFNPTNSNINLIFLVTADAYINCKVWSFDSQPGRYAFLCNLYTLLFFI